MKKIEETLIGLCKDVLIVDLPALVQDYDERAEKNDLAPISRERFIAMRRDAIAFLAARGMADELRQIVLRETQKELSAWSSNKPPVP